MSAQGYCLRMLEAFGFGPEQLAAIQPRIINLSISCFGSDGPLSHRAGCE
ncbi:MAG: CoA transferase [Rhodospirillales bacterium]